MKRDVTAVISYHVTGPPVSASQRGVTLDGKVPPAQWVKNLLFGQISILRSTKYKYVWHYLQLQT